MSEAINLYRWGILGTGAIAGQFAAQLARCSNASLHAVASRSNERAKAMMSSWGAKVGYGSYEALVADSEVDIVVCCNFSISTSRPLPVGLESR